MLLGSLTSRLYHLRPTHVGAVVSSVAIGALIAVPFQKANIFSKSRCTPQRTNSMTFDQTITWTSHLVRRAMFVLALPVVGALYVVVSTGPPMHVAVPAALAALMGFLSCLGISECNGMLMEIWDCSDLPSTPTICPPERLQSKPRANYSAFPRINAGFAIIHSLSFALAGLATVVGGLLQRNIGQRAASGVVAGILLFLSLFLMAVLVRFRNLRIIPGCKCDEMEKWTMERRMSLHRHARTVAIARSQGRTDLDHTVAEEPQSRPMLLGNPTRKHRRMNLLELGALSRWSEIRKINQLVDQDTHLNRQAVRDARDEIGKRGNELVDDLYSLGEMVRNASKRSLRSLHGNSHSHSHDSETGLSSKDLARSMMMHNTATGVSSPEAHRVRMPGEIYAERDCFVGQIIEEEPERFAVAGWPNSEDVSSGSPGLAASQTLHRGSVKQVDSDTGR